MKTFDFDNQKTVTRFGLGRPLNSLNVLALRIRLLDDSRKSIFDHFFTISSFCKYDIVFGLYRIDRNARIIGRFLDVLYW